MMKTTDCVSVQRILIGLLLCIWQFAPLRAEIHTDGSLGPVRNLSGPDYLITESLGSRVGHNLFHSFQTFNIHNGESATFTGSADITNVVSRITGGELSTIDGVLRSEIGSADFYFINPAGVAFGPHASVDVPGAFHVSTADELRFGDGRIFSASDPEVSSLSFADPAAFGFNGGHSPRITVDRSELVMAPGSSVGLTGGEVILNAATLKAEAGEVRIVAQGDAAGAVALSGTDAVEARGTMSLTDSQIDVSGDGGGQLLLRGGAIALTESDLSNLNRGDSDATGGTDIQAQELQMRGGEVRTHAFSKGKAGTVVVRVENQMELLDGGVIWSNTSGKGDAGEVRVEAGRLRLYGLESALITGIASWANAGSEGNAGTVTVKVADQMELLYGAEISSYTRGNAKGDAGDVRVEAGRLRVDDQGSESLTLIESTTQEDSEGDSGSVTVRVADHLELFDGSTIRSGTAGKGDGGDLFIEAGRLTIDGQGSSFFKGISTQAGLGSEGSAGALTVKVAGRLELLDGAVISSDTFGKGNAAEMVIEAGELKIDGQANGSFTGISAQANRSEGNASAITVRVAGQLELLNGGAISSSTFANGDAGEVLVEAGRLKIDGREGAIATGISSSASSNSAGQAGYVTVKASHVELFNGATISIAASPTVSEERLAALQTPNLVIHADRLTLSGDSEITAHSSGNIPAGPITLYVGGLLKLRGSRITTEAATGDGGPIGITGGTIILQDAQITTSTEGGDGGDIVLRVPVLVMATGFIQANTAGSGASGGDILIDTRQLVAAFDSLAVGGQQREVFTPRSGPSVIQAAAPDGVSGDVAINAPDVDVAGVLVEMEPGFGGQPISDNPCRMDRGSQPSSLTAMGRGGLPISAEEPASLSPGNFESGPVMGEANQAGPGKSPADTCEASRRRPSHSVHQTGHADPSAGSNAVSADAVDD